MRRSNGWRVPGAGCRAKRCRCFLFICGIFLVVAFFLPAAAQADPVLEGYTVVSGRGYAFELKAPRGWYLDDAAGREQGLNVVFFPKGYEWDNAPAVCYARVRTVGGGVNRVEDQVKDTLRNLRQNGATAPEVRFVSTITTQDASKAQIYYFMGDRFGNREATAYVQAKASIQAIASLHALVTLGLLADPTGYAPGFTSLLLTLQRVPDVLDEAFRPLRFRVPRRADCLICQARPTPASSEELDAALDQALARLGDA